jgi:hypothetical protein
MKVLVLQKKTLLILLGGANKTGDLWQRIGDRKQMTEELLKSWKKANLDLLLTPTYPFPAVPHNMPGRLQRTLTNRILV